MKAWLTLREDIGMADIGAQELREITRGLDDTSRVVFQTQYSSEKKSRGVTTILAVIFGFDRFYLGQIGLGIFKWLTFGGLFVWWFVTFSLRLAGLMSSIGTRLGR